MTSVAGVHVSPSPRLGREGWGGGPAFLFGALLVLAASCGGDYIIFKTDSVTFVAAPFEFATGKKTADMGINPGLISEHE